MKIFQKLGIVDIVIVLGLLIALLVGFCTLIHVRQTADKQIEATSPITFQVFLRGVTFTSKDFPIVADEKTFITIRNVPYTELNVVGVNYQPRRILLPNKNIMVTDPSQPDLYDAIITVEDVAKITKDGAVVGGNKVKMGLPIILEGKNYKFAGTISNIQIEDGMPNNKMTKRK